MSLRFVVAANDIGGVNLSIDEDTRQISPERAIDLGRALQKHGEHAQRVRTIQEQVPKSQVVVV